MSSAGQGKRTSYSHSEPVFTAEQVRLLDRQCINDYGIDGYTLMVQAGEAIFSNLLSRWSDVQQLLILCGKGNNGGDGFVVARLAKQHDIQVQLVLLGELDDLQGEAKQAAEDAIEAGLRITPVAHIQWPNANEDTVIIDALLGTGLSDNVSDELEQLINKVNHSPCDVLAVDVPTGLNATTGQIMGASIEATSTVTMLAHKQGLFTGDGPMVCGQVSLAALSIPNAARENQVATGSLVNWMQLSQLPFFAKRAMNSHKGMFGHVMIIGGDLGCGGAVSLATGSALRCGAGLVSVATRPEHVSAVLARHPEAMVHGVNSGQDLEPLLTRSDVIVVGPGLGQSYWGEQLLQQVMKLETPVVLDADALNILAKKRLAHNLSKRISVLTPHPGEAARLLNADMQNEDVDNHSIQADRFVHAKTLAEMYSSSVVLKGLGSVVHTQRKMSICDNGNAGMATAGMGDVLSGIVGGLLAQQSQDRQQLTTYLHDLVCSAVCLHSAAADQIAEHGQVGMLAGDLEQAIWQLLK